MAQAAGLRIIGIQSINSPGAVHAPFVAGRMMSLSANAAVPTQISPPSNLDVSANVTVVYVARP